VTSAGIFSPARTRLAETAGSAALVTSQVVKPKVKKPEKLSVSILRPYDFMTGDFTSAVRSFPFVRVKI
jgi:hypothetical protein